MKDEDLEKDIQKFIFEKNNRLEFFYDIKNRLIFKNIKFKYNSNFISNIYAKENIWSCDYNKVLKFTKFGGKTIYDFLLYILCDELINILADLSDIEKIDNEVYKENEAIGIFAKFIISIFDIFAEDEGIFDIPEEVINKMVNEKREKIKQAYMRESLLPKELREIRKSFSSEIDSVKEQISLDNENSDINKKLEEKMEFAKSKALKTLGENATESQINEFTEDYLNEKYVQAEEEQDQFLFDELHEGYETLDTGYDYGQLPQNINYQGDDENPDFFQDNNIKLIPKRL